MTYRMVDSLWNKKRLTKGQIIQRLESLHCAEIEKYTPTRALWSAPPGTGRNFSISYEDCSGEHLQGIVDQIERWVREAKKNRD